MCGRFTLNQPVEALAKIFDVQQLPDLPAEYNIAPTQKVATVLQNPESKKREFQQLHWGLIPSWAKDPGIGAKTSTPGRKQLLKNRLFVRLLSIDAV